ncbi:NAD-dependent epimerase/dehydratase family protein [Geomonas subterranea]|uniref:NAD-dependent epimerase/dehydratase family protein n=1 Tax=Geomonas subterranea TaxID=2847989 RepID=A0ABX8LR76_9BACT|nr:MULTISPECIES: NAD-dependent epimerase/dehydratase family protein [Geomonas]QXE92025.1 NAD-dependent epimerase/dehydratase family protein [Geomonas subterranea]QXM09882.1 NAD-dependent epimerase/dehydratase family protein [Geomonas subterranea]
MRALVTGGGGFLGSAIVRQLRARGDQVVSFSRGEYPGLAALGVEQRRGDLSDLNAVVEAAKGCDVVFHVAAKAGIWGDFQEYYLANVVGTENVVSACRILGIARLVHTGSPSVVFDGSDVEGGDESLPYPAHFEAHYPHTKALAEKSVLAANSRTLSTVSLRPHLIWGPGDNHLVPRIVAKGRAGALRRIGTRACLVDTVFVENAAEAHLNAADRLAPEAPLAGKAYFISNGEPVPLWDMVNAILEAAGVPPVTRTIPAGVAYAAGIACEIAWRSLRLRGEPPMTRFVAKELATSHWFDISAARRDLGYFPRISIQEGLRLLRASFEAGA